MSVFRTILKKIFPRILLKGAHGVYNRIKSATYDNLAFPEHRLKPSEFLIYRNGYPFRENKVKTSGITDQRVKHYMDQWYDWTQEEFVLIWDQPCTIEPITGWGITAQRKLLFYSLGISRTWFLERPALIKFLSRTDDVVVDKAVSFRDSGEENYFHFFNDVIAKYFFLKANKISFDDRQVIISQKLYSKPYFQWYLAQSPELKNLKWLVQDVNYIATKSIIFCKPLTHRKDLLDQIFKPLYVPATVRKRIFVGRAKSRLRFISNFNDIVPVLTKYNIEIIDADLLPPSTQRVVFAQASLIVGVHGAGLTNIYYQNDKCSVLEIFPPPSGNYLAFHYIMIADMKGCPYQGIIGEGKHLDIMGGFTVDVSKLDEAIAALV